MRWILLVLLLAGCRYTFVPLDPGKPTFPQRPILNGTLERTDQGALLKLSVRRMPEPNYLELRWYKDDQLFQEKSIWVEQPGNFEANFDRLDDGYYRLTVSIQKSPYLQLELGTPLVPTQPVVPPPPPEN